MSFTRLLGTLAVLGALSACTPPPPERNVPELPDLAQLETTEGAPYEVSLAATGGTPPLYHSLEKAPPGFSFYTGPGLLKGPATVSGQYSFTVQVKDATGAVDTRTYRLLVHPAPSITAPAPSAATTGISYFFQLEATGGKAPLRWSLASGALPAGLILNESGQFLGMPVEPGTYAFTVRVRDVHGAQATKALSLQVRPGTGGTDGGTDAGTALTFNVANWNIEWFGDPNYGPTDDTLQLNNVHAVIADAGMDFWGLQELVDGTEFTALKQKLPGYDGFMANDSRVTYGANYYSVGEQKVGVLFRSDVVSVQKAELILTAYGTEFAGRPPLRVDLRITRNGSSVDVVAIVLHMKAFADSTSYQHRKDAAVLLKRYLDTQLPAARVLVLGDWNDDVDVSITRDSTSSSYLPTPYQNFLDDSASYTFVTRPLSLAGQRSTVSHSQFIDHQLASNELMASYESNSTRILTPSIYQYGSNTSDHYPVLSRFTFGEAPQPPPPPPTPAPLKLLWPNGGEQLASHVVRTLSWTMDGVDSVNLEYSLDDGATWMPLAENVQAGSPGYGHYTWVVPSVPATTTKARVRVSDATAPSISDESDAPFSVTWPPPVFINEYLPHEPALPDGGRDYAQQFVEVVNGSAEVVDISGWRVNDLSGYNGTSPRHTFSPGTALGPGSFFVVYSGASAIPEGAYNAVAASGGGLYFNKGTGTSTSGDHVYLQNNMKQVVDSTSYTWSTEAVSYTRNPENRTGTFVLHDTLPPGLGSSPGMRSDGGTF